MKNVIITTLATILLVLLGTNAGATENVETQSEIQQNNDESSSQSKPSATEIISAREEIEENNTKVQKVKVSIGQFEFKEVDKITFKNAEPVTLPDYPEIERVLNDRLSKIVNISNYADKTLIKEMEGFKELFNNQNKILNSQNQVMKDRLLNLEQTNNIYEKNLALAKWIIAVVSMGSIVLMLIIYLIWRGVVNVNRNEVEVVFAYEDMKKKFIELLDQVEILNEQINGNRKKTQEKKNNEEFEEIEGDTEKTEQDEDLPESSDIDLEMEEEQKKQ